MVAFLVEVFFVEAFLVEVTPEAGQGKPRSHTAQNPVCRTFSTTVPKKTGNTGGLSQIVVNEAVSQENRKKKGEVGRVERGGNPLGRARPHSERRPLP